MMGVFRLDHLAGRCACAPQKEVALAPRTSATFAKRQKERTRQEKQLAKQQRKLQRRQQKRETPAGSESDEFGSNTEIGSQSEPLPDSTMATAEAAPTERESQ